MIKIDRPPTPNIKVYTEKKHNFTQEERSFLLTLMSDHSVQFASFIPRLQDKNERFTKAEEEMLKAIAYYADPSKFKNNKKLTTSSAPTFKVYKDKELKIILEKLFKGKCAYCESKFLQVSPADIEHFRPKAAINQFKNHKDEKLIYPGYYWLAADWNNLLWSCILCNRKNILDVPNIVGAQPLGKKNRFPIADELNRIRSHNDDLSTEHIHKLIVDPCTDNPSDHFFFPINNDDLGIVKSNIMLDNNPSSMGEASIFVYGLNRSRLVFERNQEALNLKSTFLGMLRGLKAFIENTENNIDATKEETEFLFQKERFNSMLSPSAQYLALKNSLLKEFNNFELIRRLNLKVEDLIEPQ